MSRNVNTGRFLVTGGAGFMGSAWIREKLSDDAFKGEITNLDLLTYAGNLDNLGGCYQDARYRLVQGDIRDAKLVDRLVKEADFVVHFAAESHVDRSIDDAEDFVQTNVMGTYRLLEAVRQSPNCHFHHISTDEVYGSIQDGVFVETSPYLPNSPYAASKAASDHFVRAYHKTYGISVTMSHASNNYGPCQYPEKLIPLMITRLVNGESLPIYGKGINVRDWLYVEDHVRAVNAILANGKSGDVYNIGSENPRRNIDVVHDLIEIVEKVTGKRGLAELMTFVPDRLGHDLRYAIDASKLRKELGWKPQVDFKEGLEKTVNWYVSREKNRLCHSS